MHNEKYLLLETGRSKWVTDYNLSLEGTTPTPSNEGSSMMVAWEILHIVLLIDSSKSHQNCKKYVREMSLETNFKDYMNIQSL